MSKDIPVNDEISLKNRRNSDGGAGSHRTQSSREHSNLLAFLCRNSGNTESRHP